MYKEAPSLRAFAQAPRRVRGIIWEYPLGEVDARTVPKVAALLPRDDGEGEHEGQREQQADARGDDQGGAGARQWRDGEQRERGPRDETHALALGPGQKLLQPSWYSAVNPRDASRQPSERLIELVPAVLVSARKATVWAKEEVDSMEVMDPADGGGGGLDAVEAKRHPPHHAQRKHQGPVGPVTAVRHAVAAGIGATRVRRRRRGARRGRHRSARSGATGEVIWRCREPRVEVHASRPGSVEKRNATIAISTCVVV